MCGLVTFTVTSWISLILRLVALVVISMWTDYFNTYCDDEYVGRNRFHRTQYHLY